MDIIQRQRQRARLARRQQLPTDEEMRRLAGAQIIAHRIYLGLSPVHILDQLSHKTGYRAKFKNKEAIARRLLEELEAQMLAHGDSPTRLSFYQRYCRVVGLRFDTQVVAPDRRRHSVHTLQRAIRSRNKRIKTILDKSNKRLGATRLAKRRGQPNSTAAIQHTLWHAAHQDVYAP